MKVVILCGGQGTRIRAVAENLPKPMMPIGEFPILWHIMKSYAGAGFRDFVLCLGYKGHLIKEFFLNYEAYTNDLTVTLGREKSVELHGDHDEAGWWVTLADTGHDAMTGARVKRVARYVEGEDDFMLTYGDGLGDIDLRDLLAFHRAHGKLMTVTGVRPMGRFGELEADESGRVVEFNEKPQAIGGRISGGFFVCRWALLGRLGDDDLVLEEEPMRELVREGELMTYRHDGFWQCMDTYRDYRLLNDLWDAGRASWKTW